MADESAPYKTALVGVPGISRTDAERLRYLAAMAADLAVLTAQQTAMLAALYAHLKNGTSLGETNIENIWNDLFALQSAHAAEVDRMAKEITNGQ